jgi:hypothetical protein
MRSLIVPTLLALTACNAGHSQRMNAMTAAPAPAPTPAPSPGSDADQPPATRTLTIELLALDLETCGRCTGTGANLDAAIATVAEVLREADVAVDVRKTVVTSAAQAENLRFESSPTIRINGRDIALELRESNCGDCGDICGCEGQVDCRVWVWQGKEHVEAPRALIIDAILRGYSHAWEPMPKTTNRFRLPENLRHFFEATSHNAAQTNDEDCCDRTACCDVSEKDACCGVAAPTVAGGAGKHEACGCKG